MIYMMTANESAYMVETRLRGSGHWSRYEFYTVLSALKFAIEHIDDLDAVNANIYQAGELLWRYQWHGSN